MIKRIIICCIILVGLLGAALFALPKLLLPTHEINQQIIDQISRWTGQTAEFSRSRIVSFFPKITVELEDVALSGALDVSDKPFIKMERLQGQLDFWSALTGKVTVSDFKFIRPEIQLITNQIGKSNWHFRRGEISKKLQAAKDAVAQSDSNSNGADLSSVTLALGHFQIQEGLVIYQDAVNKIDSRWSGVNLDVSYPDLEGVASINGDAIWNGEVVKINASSVAPLNLFAGGNSDMSMLLEAKPLVLEFDGNVNSAAKGVIKGSAKISSHSARRFLNWAGYNVPIGATFGAFELSGDVLGTISELKFTDASMKLDGNESTGILTISKKQGQLIKLIGTIAVDALEITPYLAQLSVAKSGSSNERDLIDLSFLKNFNLDMRLSAKTVQANNNTLENLAGTLRVNEGRATIDIGQADIFDGTLQMVLHADGLAGEVATHLKLNGFGINASNIAKFMPLGNLDLDVAGDVHMDIKASGVTDLDLLKTVTGEFTFVAKDGVVEGVNLTALVDLKNNGSLLDVGEIFKGETPFEKLTMDTKLNNGVLYLGDVHLKAGQIITRLAGKADFARNALALHGVAEIYAAAQPDSDNQIEARPELLDEQAFIIGGTLDTPFFAPKF